uniref:Ribosomal RNA-processing protein 44 n=1 Tax=Octactis speculum TaxID=3111310 RepID=A0A7S2B4Y1_9STRA|mmetsp:Transcript_19588/g.26560  ORF Transcript_19588/g.26560 Transcript_19588/m.26560 type:complete len:986 (+) Transcript_19588:133-3090(+)|eukprot:CAMPEP_0185768544 /NCGR_PEP_ID=MMETSP1174-20130828/50346_1 /TAXON_ID=35687 /ORGANISM="Dictyocha speculum, Strain CCMP1381" /LENGTH=985 /DNA_ID=CAMNT_0028453271 /DNA_START=133 /DNA_END=3090 /DNA_ORIENTATION=-
MTDTTSSTAALECSASCFYRRAKKGHRVTRIVEEQYIRKDLGFGSWQGRTLQKMDLVELLKNDKVGSKKQEPKAPDVMWLVPDTNVVLHQMDLLENSGCPSLDHIIILETVLQEVRHNNLSLFRRLKELLKHSTRRIVFLSNEHYSATFVQRKPEESPNDRNDRAIRIAAAWYIKQAEGSAPVLMLSNDRDNLRKAKKQGISCETVEAFVETLATAYPQLSDLVNRNTDTAAKAGTRELFYDEHLPMSQLQQGVKAGRFFQGTVRCDRWDTCYVVISDKKTGERVSITISGAENVNRAVDGDIVAIKILDAAAEAKAAASEEALPVSSSSKEEEDGAGVPEPTAPPRVGDMEGAKVETTKGGGAKTGRVVGIIRRNWFRHYCGALAGDKDDRLLGEPVRGGNRSVLIIPAEKRLPRVRIQTRQRDNLVGKRILFAIDSWPASSKLPNGHYVSTIGNSGDKAIETEVILLEHDIPCEAFSGEVLSCLPEEGWTITPENSVGRRDLRHLPVMSIDPPGCRDIDDALHCVPLENGNFQVGVHIADVTHFVEAGSALDIEAGRRSTSTYLVDKRLDMLPKMLTERLCSLVGNQDRFAFSVLIEMTPAADVVNADFCKSMIHSIGAHSYGEAQLMMDDPTRNDVKATAVRNLNSLAKKLRARRMDAGALTLASPEVRFVLDTETQNPLDVQLYALKETNALVEEFMLLGNITVGKKILRHFPTLSCLRRHPAPSRSQFDPLISIAGAVGHSIKVDDSKMLSASLDGAVDPKEPYFNKLLRILCTRCMSPAQYFISGEQVQDDWHHYGLAAPIYTHFTSPIRRYADVIVHRLLAASIGAAPLPALLLQKTEMHELAENMNRRHRAAQLAGRASVSLHTQIYFKHHPTSDRAFVISVFHDKINVLVPKFGIEGTVWLTDENDNGMLDYDADTHTLRHKDGAKVQVFDSVVVYICVLDLTHGRSKVKLYMTSPQLGEQPSTDEEPPVKKQKNK